MKPTDTPFRLNELTIDPGIGTIESGAGVERLPPRLMSLLCLLAAAGNQTVDRDALVQALWPRGFVNEDALSRAVAELRRHLGDDARNPQFIETVPKRGYRLLASLAPVVENSVDDSRESSKSRAGPMTVAALLLVSVILFMAWPRPEFSTPAALMATAALLTADPVMKYHPQLSPDGELLTYIELHDDRMALILLPTDQPTEKYQLNSELSVRSPVFAPDSKGLAVALLDHSGCRVHRWTVTGGKPEPLAPCVIPNESAILDWSADGQFIAYVDTDPITGSGAIWQLSLADGTGEKLTSPPDSYSFDTRPRYSPDGNWLSFSRGTRAAREIWVLDLQQRRGDNQSAPVPRQLSFDHQFIISHQWMPDSHSIILDSERSGYRALWSLDLDGEWKLLGARDAESPSLAGNRLAFKVSQFESNIWPVDLATGEPADEPLVSSNKYDSNPTLSPDGTLIAFSSSRTGRGSIWVAALDGSDQRLVYEPESGRVVAPAWSPDGSHLIATQYQAGGQGVVRVTLEGDKIDILPTTGARPYGGTFSADGTWLYYIAKAGIEGNRLWRQPVDGSAPGEIVIGQPVNSFRLLPDGVVFYTKYARAGLYRAKLDEPDHEALVVPDLNVSSWGDWVIADGWIYYMAPGPENRTALMKAPLEGGNAQWVSDFHPTSLWPNLAVIPETNTILVARTDRAQSDLFLVELDP